MNPKIYSILDDMEKCIPKNPIATSDIHTYLSIKASQLSVLLASEAEKSTKKIVHLTWFLCGLTVALLVFAIVQTIIFK